MAKATTAEKLAAKRLSLLRCLDRNILVHQYTQVNSAIKESVVRDHLRDLLEVATAIQIAVE